ncbi:hypothetical protein FE783_08025 [Paenibacillus mesophilus]|uniref:hypothetical protein n=1 Tax=Paenibacillus mesophilus TaxID=2582849 RepID=UPI00110DAB57|nr:hypothetical protein [Paenibacillus mesophilus]TMV50632.1 hypothetical protein FE783_08025 [Paenibacillus mesophilus]
MKLIRSKTEQDFRVRLINSHKSLFQEKSNERLLSVLRNSFPDMRTAYFIGHTPEQEEDLYTILINTDTIARIEMNRYNHDIKPNVVVISLRDYVIGLSKMSQIKLTVALDLAKKDLE